MAEFKKSNESRDYKERFEFRLTLKGKDGRPDSFICQRYFRINNFNPTCLNSYDLADTIRGCARIIDEDLKGKSRVYLAYVAPQVFKTEEEMYEFFKDEENCKRMRLGHGIVVSETGNNYVWGKDNTVVPSPITFETGEFYKPLTEDDVYTYKFAFYDNAAKTPDGKLIFNKDNQIVLDTEHPKEICSTIWEGFYPKEVRNQIDLSNRRGKFEGEDMTRLSFEQQVLNKMVEGRGDLVYGIVKDICAVCCQSDEWYNLVEGTKVKKA